MNRYLALVYGLLAVVAGGLPLVYAVGFIGGFLVPKTIDSGIGGLRLDAISINAGLLLLFGLQHSVMARSSFKSMWTKFIPEPIERSTYVWLSGFALAFLIHFWRPIPIIVWRIDFPLAAWFLWGLFLAGWGILLYSALLIDPFELFGLRQVWFYFRGWAYRPPDFTVRSLYRWCRHPLMLGFLIGVWATPRMTVGHLLFSAGMSVYIGIGVFLEERDLVRQFGDSYRRYRQSTAALIPLIRWKR